jgi:hypothetical protein
MVVAPGAVECLSIFSLFLDLCNFFISDKDCSLLRYGKYYDHKKFYGMSLWFIKVSAPLLPLLRS